MILLFYSCLHLYQHLLLYLYLLNQPLRVVLKVMVAKVSANLQIEQLTLI